MLYTFHFAIHLLTPPQLIDVIHYRHGFMDLTLLDIEWTFRWMVTASHLESACRETSIAGSPYEHHLRASLIQDRDHVSRKKLPALRLDARSLDCRDPSDEKHLRISWIQDRDQVRNKPTLPALRLDTESLDCRDRSDGFKPAEESYCLPKLKEAVPEFNRIEMFDREGGCATECGNAWRQ